MHGASNRTVRACSIHSFCIQRNRFLQGEILLKSACGAYAYALAAGDTSCLGKRLLESRHNNCIKSTFHKTESSYAHNLVAGTYTESAEDTLVGISQDERMLVMVVHFVHIACETVRIHVIHIRVRDQLTLEVVFTSAFQTAVSFLNCLILVVSENNLGEVIFSLFRVKLFHSRTAHSLTVLESSRSNVLLGHIVVGLIFDLFAAEISVYDQIALLRVADGLNSDGDLVVTAVTAGEYARDSGHIGIFVVYKAALPGEFHAVDAFRVYSLSDSQDNGVDVDGLCLALNRDGRASSGCIRLAQFHNLKNHLTAVSVFIRDDLKRIGQVQEDNALLLCLFDLQHIRGHLVLGSSVDIVNLVSAQTYCCTAGVHSGVTAADDGNFLAQVDRLVAYNLTQEIDTADHAFGVFALAANACGNPCADTNAYRVEISADGLKGNVLADLGVGDHGHAHFLKDSDLLVENFFWQTVLRNTIAEHTAKLWHCLINSHVVAKLTKEISHGDTVRSAADHGHVLACIRLALRNEGIFAELVCISGKSLQVRDRDGLVHHTAAACCLAGMRTYTSDSARKRNVLSDQLDSFFILSVCDQANIALAVCTCRTCQHTGRTAVSLVVGKKKLKVRLSGFDDTGRIGMYYHIRRNLCCAGFPEFRIAFLLYHAQAARAVDFCSLIIAESRNKDVVLSADFEDGLSGKPVDLFSVDV